MSVENYKISTDTADQKGSLYVVSTPIGNLGDITFRAVETLKSVDLIACEDTRKASILAKRFEIDTPRISYHEHNARKRCPKLIAELLGGKDLALISDAGTPGISDPGYLIIRDCINNEIPVIQIPGASAFLTALAVSGLPTDRFIFEGFLPPKKGRKKRLTAISEVNCTIIFYESPHRIKRTINELYEFFGDRRVVIARELTKKFEEIRRTSLSNAVEIFETTSPKGEYVVIVEGCK
ncbi:MAG: 16S rRNA (cytidine(1402)-2'-O)-methyltransferase [bacterium]|nr:16S rRNA (cytidine(1402)-2'-O)-methyltransferase [bacterium]